jgi:hypothetical protein
MKKISKLCLSALMLAGSFVLSFGTPAPAYSSHNPCHNLDNKPLGCFRTWSPQTLCCRGNNRNGCYTICL